MSTSSRPVLRGERSERVSPHAFIDVSDLPSPARARRAGGEPGATGDDRWEESVARGEAEGRARGYAEGHREGLEAGIREGRESGVAIARAEAERAAAERIAPLLDAVDEAHRALVARDAVTLAELEGQVVDLALALASAVLEREVSVADDPGADALRRALRLAPQRGAVVARLAPDDVARLGDIADVAAGRSIEVVADPDVATGGCVVEVGAASVDASIDAALERARAVLSGQTDGAVL